MIQQKLLTTASITTPIHMLTFTCNNWGAALFFSPVGFQPSFHISLCFYSRVSMRIRISFSWVSVYQSTPQLTGLVIHTLSSYYLIIYVDLVESSTTTRRYLLSATSNNSLKVDQPLIYASIHLLLAYIHIPVGIWKKVWLKFIAFD